MNGAIALFHPYVFMAWPGKSLPSLPLLFKVRFLLLYRVNRKEGSIFWEVIVSVIVRKTVSNTEWLPRW
jgi:hypothetical protein